MLLRSLIFSFLISLGAAPANANSCLCIRNIVCYYCFGVWM